MKRRWMVPAGKGKLDDSEALPERVNKIPVIRISVYVKDIHAKNSSFLRPSSFETQTLWIVEGDDLFGEFRTEEGGRGASIPMASETSGAIK